MPELSLIENGQNFKIIRPYDCKVGGKMPVNVFYCKDDEDNEYIKGTKLTIDDYLVSSYICDDTGTQHFIYYQITSIKGTQISYYDHYRNQTCVLRRQGIPALKNRYYLRDVATTSNIKYWASENEVMNMMVDWYQDMDAIIKESELLLSDIHIDINVKDKEEDNFYDLQVDVYGKCINYNKGKCVATKADEFTRWIDTDNSDIRCYSYNIDTFKNEISDFNRICIHIKHNLKTNKLDVSSSIIYRRSNNNLASLIYERGWPTSIYEMDYEISIHNDNLHACEDCIDPEQCIECIC